MFNQWYLVIFLVQPGNRTYARKILFSGNYLTNDEVLRREMRQFEGAWASDNLIEGSKLRLERLGFFKEVNVETIPVPGTEDQVDIEFTVENKKLWMLQTRSGKRTAKSALKLQ